MSIHDGDQSSGHITILDCSVDGAPKCAVDLLQLEVTGQLGWTEFFAERLEVDGSWFMSGTGCPFTGTWDVGGSLGAFIVPDGGGFLEVFEPYAEDATRATGLYVGNEYWHVSTQVEPAASGPNQGEEFSVEVGS
jgi:hypothetical protein